MPTSPAVDVLKEAGELAKMRLLEQARAMYGVVMGTDGETFGDSQMSRSDIILRWATAAQNGTLDVLKAQSPKVYARGLREFNAAVMAEMEAAAKVKV